MLGSTPARGSWWLLALLTACGVPAPARGTPAAAIVLPESTASATRQRSCTSLAFNPSPGAAYRVTAAQGQKPQTAHLVMTAKRDGDGWRVEEREFRLEGSYDKDAVGDLEGALLQTHLGSDAMVDGPAQVERSRAKPGIVEKISFFAYVAYASPAGRMCIGDTWGRTWTQGRFLRNFRYTLDGVDATARRAHVRVEGTSQHTDKPTRWAFTGFFDVALDDGFVREARLSVRLAAAADPANASSTSSDYERTVTVERDDPRD